MVPEPEGVGHVHLRWLWWFMKMLRELCILKPAARDTRDKSGADGVVTLGINFPATAHFRQNLFPNIQREQYILSTAV